MGGANRLGLQGYFIADAEGRRLDKAPHAIAQDPAARDGAAEAGLSCLNCHQGDGVLPRTDEIRDTQRNSAANARIVDQVLALYAAPEDLQAAFDADRERYQTARGALEVANLTTSTLHELDGEHLGVLGSNDVAAVLGIPADDFTRALEASPQALPPEVVTLRTSGGSIARDSFDAIAGRLIEALGLGRPLRASSSNDAGSGSDPDCDDFPNPGPGYVPGRHP